MLCVFPNLGELVVSLCGTLSCFLYLYQTMRRKCAVGYRELSILHLFSLFLFANFCLESSCNFGMSEYLLPMVISMSVVFITCLFQLLPDGKPLSLIVFLLTCLGLFGSTFVVQMYVSISYLCYFAIAMYILLCLVLVQSNLSVRWPLFHVFVCVLFLGLGILLPFYENYLVFVTGKTIFLLCLFFGYLEYYRFWVSITLDEWESG